MRRPGTKHFLCIIKYWKLNTAGIHVDSNQSELFSKGFSCVTSKKIHQQKFPTLKSSTMLYLKALGHEKIKYAETQPGI